MKKKQNKYLPPALTVVEFRMERGYAGSFGPVGDIQQEVNMFIQDQVMQTDANGNLVGTQLNTTVENNFTPSGNSGWTFENGSHF